MRATHCAIIHVLVGRFLCAQISLHDQWKCFCALLDGAMRSQHEHELLDFSILSIVCKQTLILPMFF